MAIYWPLSSGLWSTLSNWASSDAGLSGIAGALPTANDEVYANNKGIYINIDATAKFITSISLNLSPLGTVAAGGTFVLNNNVTLSAGIWRCGSTTSLLQHISAAPSTATLVGGVTGGHPTGAAVNIINNTNSGTLIIRGDFSPGNLNAVGLQWNAANTGSGTLCCFSTIIQGSIGQINNNSSGTLCISAINIFGGYIADTTTNPMIMSQGGNLYVTAQRIDAATSLNNPLNIAILRTTTIRVRGTTNTVITCPLIGGSGTNNSGDSYAVIEAQNNSNENFTIFGNIRGSGIQTGAFGLSVGARGGAGNSIGGGVTVYGNISGGASSVAVNRNTAVVGTGSFLRVFGNVYGNSTNNVAGISPTSQAGGSTLNRVEVNGNVVGSVGPGISNTDLCLVYAKRVVGAPGGPTNPTGGTSVGLANPQNGLAYVEEIEFGAQGATPVSGPVFLVNRPNTVLVMGGPPPTFASTTFFGNLNVPGLFPPVSSVRLGTVYGNGDFTGTMAVPVRDAVQVGVPIDNTVGTFVLSPESFWTIKRSNSALNDPTTIGYRIKNLATIASVGKTLASFNLSGAAPGY